MKKTLMALVAAGAAAIAGCSSAPNWKEPSMNQKPIVLEDEVKDAPKKPIIDDSPGIPDTIKKTELSGGYGTIELEVAYKFENTIAAGGFDGYIKFRENLKGREFTDYEKMEMAFRVNKEGNISSNDVSKEVKSFGKIPFVDVSEDNLRRTYTESIAVATPEVSEEIMKLIEGKSDAEKAKVAKAVRSFYNGKDAMTMHQLRKVKEYFK